MNKHFPYLIRLQKAGNRQISQKTSPKNRMVGDMLAFLTSSASLIRRDSL